MENLPITKYNECINHSFNIANLYRGGKFELLPPDKARLKNIENYNDYKKAFAELNKEN